MRENPPAATMASPFKEKDPSRRVGPGEGSKAVTSTVAIVWPCPLGVDEYAAAGRDVEVPRPTCPSCAKPMIFWSGYPRTVRDGDDRLIWVRRSRCVPCRVSHCLLPAFCLRGRLYGAEAIGAALEAIIDGALAREVADATGFPYPTVRDWRRRHRDRAPVLAAGFAALAVELGAGAPELAAEPERAALEALGWAWDRARSRFGTAVPGRWRFWSVVSGGEALGTTTHTPWISVGGRRLIPPVP